MERKRRITLVLLIIALIFLVYIVLKPFWTQHIEGMSVDKPVKFRITFSSDWGSNQHEINFPTDPHTGNMFLITHNKKFDLFSPGNFASKAISNTSMYGTIDDLRALVRDDPNVGSVHNAPVLKTPGKHTFIIKTTSQHPLLSFVTMIAPSPDWFTGISSFPLANKDWVPALRLPLYVYDAGTDSGTRFNTQHYIKNRPTPITIKNDTFLYPDGKLKPIAYLQISQMK